MSGIPFMRDSAPDLYGSLLPYIDEVLFMHLQVPDQTYNQVFKVRDSNRMREQTTEFSGFGLFEDVTEGAKIPYDTILQGFDKTYTHVDYAKGYIVTRQALRDDLFGVISDAAPALGQSASASIETVAWNVFNNGFTTETTPDNVALFSASHVLIDGSATGNNLVTGDLSVSNLETAINRFDNQTDDRGLPTQAMANMLVIHPNNRWRANEILRSEQKSGTANNDINVLNQIGMSILECKYLTNATDWFVMMPPSSGLNQLRFYWREEPFTDHISDFDSRTIKTSMGFAFSVGASGWRGVVGGNGA